MDEVIEYFGGRAAMAETFKVERAAITQWSKGELPPARAIQIEQLTQGVFTAIELMETNKRYNDKNIKG